MSELKTYSIDIQDGTSGAVETRQFTLVSTSTLRARTSVLRFQKALQDLKILKANMQTDNPSDEDSSASFQLAIDMMDAHKHATEELLRAILIGDWTNVSFDLINSDIIDGVLVDFFTLYNEKKTD